MTAPPSIPSYLVVDDDLEFCERLCLALQRHGHPDVTFATTYQNAVALVERRVFDRALIDMRLEGDKNGFDVVRAILERRPCRIVMVTNYPSLEALRLAHAAGAIDLIYKTEDVPEIQHAFARIDRQVFDVNRVRSVPPTLDEVEWEHINRVLTITDGHATLAAEILGISRATLYRKLDRRPPSTWSRAVHRAVELRARGRVSPRRKKSSRRKKP
jgi:two-component system response regulator RegA